jgi:hypothetical protein
MTKKNPRDPEVHEPPDEIDILIAAAEYAHFCGSVDRAIEFLQHLLDIRMPAEGRPSAP